MKASAPKPDRPAPLAAARGIAAPRRRWAPGALPRRAAEATLRASPLQPLLRRRASGRIAIFAYHGIDDPERFEAHLAYAARTMRPVSVDELQAAVDRGRPLPPRAVLFTFDDGERSVLEEAMPLMRARGIPGVVFVVAGLIGTTTPFWFREVEELARLGGVTTVASRPRSPRSLLEALKRVPDERRLMALAELRQTARGGVGPAAQLTFDELRRLESAGLRVGSHTLSHPCLNRCGMEDIRRELSESDRVIEAALGARSRLIAYPNGDWDERVVRIAEAVGYRLGFAYDHRLAEPRISRPLVMERLRVESTISVDRLAILVSGLGVGFDHAWGAFRRRLQGR